MAKSQASTTPFQVKLAGLTGIPVGTPFAVYERGSDTVFDRVRIGGTIELALDDGTTKTANVQALQAAPLIDLIAGSGSQAAHMVGRVYSPLALVQHLTDNAPEDVLDVTKLYTAIVVLVPHEMTNLAPAA